MRQCGLRAPALPCPAPPLLRRSTTVRWPLAHARCLVPSSSPVTPEWQVPVHLIPILHSSHWPGPRPPRPQVNYQVELVRFATDNESIGAIICKRAEQLQASAVVMAKHNKGAIKVGGGGGAG